MMMRMMMMVTMAWWWIDAYIGMRLMHLAVSKICSNIHVM